MDLEDSIRSKLDNLASKLIKSICKVESPKSPFTIKIIKTIWQSDGSASVEEFFRINFPNCEIRPENTPLLASFLLIVYASLSSDEAFTPIKTAMCSMDNGLQMDVASMLAHLRSKDLAMMTVSDLVSAVEGLRSDSPERQAAETPDRMNVSVDSNASPLVQFFRTPQRRSGRKNWRKCRLCDNGRKIEALQAQVEEDESEKNQTAEELRQANKMIRKLEKNAERDASTIEELRLSISNLEVDLSNRASINQKLLRKIEETSDHNKALAQDIDAYSNDISTLRNQISHLEKANSSLNSQLKELRDLSDSERVKNTSDETALLRSLLASKTSEFEELLEAYNAQKQKVNLDLTEQSYEEPETGLCVIEILLAECREENAALKKALEENRVTMQDLEESLKVKVNELDSFKVEKVRLSQELKEQIVELTNLSQKSIEDQKAIECLKSTLCDSQKTIEEKEELLTFNLAELKRLNTEFDDLVRKYDEDRKEIVQLKNTLADSQKTIELNDVALLEKTEELMAVNNQLASLSEKTIVKDKIIEDITSKLSESEKTIEGLHQEVEEKTIELNKLSEQSCKYRKEIENLSENLFNKEQLLTGKIIELERLNIEHDDLILKYDEGQKEILQLTNTLADNVKTMELNDLTIHEKAEELVVINNEFARLSEKNKLDGKIIEELTAKLNQSEKTIQQLEDKVEENTVELSNLTEQSSEYRKAIEELTDTLCVSQKTIDDKEQLLVDKMNELQKLNIEHDNSTRKYDEEILQLNTMLAEKQNIIQHNEVCLQAKSDELMVINNQLATLSEKANVNEKIIAETTAKLTESEKTVNELQRDVEEKTIEINNLTEKSSQYSEQIENLNSELCLSQKTIADKEQLLSETMNEVQIFKIDHDNLVRKYDEEIVQLNISLTESQKTIELKELALQEETKKLIDVKNEFTSLSERASLDKKIMEEMETKLHQYEKTIEELERNVDEKTNELKNLSEKSCEERKIIENLEETLCVSQKTIADNEQLLEEKVAELQNLKIKHDDLIKKYEDNRKEIAQLQVTLVDSRKTIELKELALQEETENLINVRSEFASSSERDSEIIEEMTSKVNEAEKTIKQLDTEFEEKLGNLKQDNERLLRKLDVNEIDLQEKTEELVAINNEFARLSERAQHNDKVIEEMTSKLGQSEKTIEKLEHQVNEKTIELKNLSEKSSVERKAIENLEETLAVSQKAIANNEQLLAANTAELQKLTIDHDDLVKKYDDDREKIAQLNITLADCQKTIELNELALKELTEKLEKVNDEHQKVMQELEESLNDLNCLKVEKEGLAHDLEEKTVELTKLSAKSCEDRIAMENLNDKLYDSHKTIADKEKLLTANLGELQRLKMEYDDLARKYDENSNEIVQITSTLAESRKTIELKELTVEGITEELTVIKNEFESLSERANLNDKIIEEITAKLDQSEMTKKQLERESEEKLGCLKLENGSLSQELEEKTIELNKLSKQCCEDREVIANLEETLCTAQKTIADKEQLLSVNLEEVQNLKIELDEHVRKCEENRKIIEEMTAKLSQSEMTVKQLEHEFEEKLCNLKLQNDSLSRELNEKTSELNIVTQKSKEEIENLTIKLCDSHKIIEEKEQALSSNLAELQNLKMEHHDLTRKYDEDRKVIEDVTSKLVESEQTIKQLHNEVEEISGCFKAANDRLTNELEEKNIELNNLSQKLCEDQIAMEKLKETLCNSEKTIADKEKLLEVNLVELESFKIEHNDLVKKYDEEIVQLKNALADSRRTIELNELALEEKTDKLIVINNKFAKLSERASLNDKIIEEMTVKLSQSDKTTKQLQLEVEEKSQGVNSLQDKHNQLLKLEDDYAALEKRVVSLAEINSRLSTEILKSKELSSTELALKEKELLELRTALSDYAGKFKKSDTVPSETNTATEEHVRKSALYEVQSKLGMILALKQEEESCFFEGLTKMHLLAQKLEQVDKSEPAISRLQEKKKILWGDLMEFLKTSTEWSDKVSQWLATGSPKLPELLSKRIRKYTQIVNGIQKLIEEVEEILTERIGLSDSLEEVPVEEKTFEVINLHDATYSMPPKVVEPPSQGHKSRSAWSISPPSKKTSVPAVAVKKERGFNGESWVIPAGPAPAKPARKSEVERVRSSSVSSTRSLPSGTKPAPKDQLTERVSNLEVALSRSERNRDALTKENSSLKRNISALEDKIRQEKEAHEANSASTRTKYERQLEKHKEEMRRLYNQEVGKYKREISRLSEEQKQDQKVKDRLEEQKARIDDLLEQNRRYKEHIDELRNENWRLGDKILQVNVPRSGGNKISPQESWVKSKGSLESSSTSSRQQSSLFPPMPVEDEDEIFDNHCLEEIQRGYQEKEEDRKLRIAELQSRNSLCPPHLKSSYPGETQMDGLKMFSENDLRSSMINFNFDSHSLTDSSDPSMTKSLLPSEKGKKKEQTSYKRPGPPTPSKNGRPSLGGELKGTPKKALREQNAQEKGRGTPNRLKALFTSRSSKRESLGGLSATDEVSCPAWWWTLNCFLFSCAAAIYAFLFRRMGFQ